MTTKKMLTGCQWASSLDVHPYGDNVIIGSYDKKVLWFDMDLGNTPYKNMKYHEKAIRSVAFSRKYPLMASASDDGNNHTRTPPLLIYFTFISFHFLPLDLHSLDAKQFVL